MYRDLFTSFPDWCREPRFTSTAARGNMSFPRLCFFIAVATQVIMAACKEVTRSALHEELRRDLYADYSTYAGVMATGLAGMTQFPAKFVVGIVNGVTKLLWPWLKHALQACEDDEERFAFSPEMFSAEAFSAEAFSPEPREDRGLRADSTLPFSHGLVGQGTSGACENSPTAVDDFNFIAARLSAVVETALNPESSYFGSYEIFSSKVKKILVKTGIPASPVVDIVVHMSTRRSLLPHLLAVHELADLSTFLRASECFISVRVEIARRSRKRLRRLSRARAYDMPVDALTPPVTPRGVNVVYSAEPHHDELSQRFAESRRRFRLILLDRGPSAVLYARIFDCTAFFDADRLHADGFADKYLAYPAVRSRETIDLVALLSEYPFRSRAGLSSRVLRKLDDVRRLECDIAIPRNILTGFGETLAFKISNKCQNIYDSLKKIGVSKIKCSLFMRRCKIIVMTNTGTHCCDLCRDNSIFS